MDSIIFLKIIFYLVLPFLGGRVLGYCIIKYSNRKKSLGRPEYLSKYPNVYRDIK